MAVEELFELSSPLGRRVAERGGDPIAAARALLPELTEEERVATLNAHPRIGQVRDLSPASRREQGSEAGPEVLAALERLNEEYERRFGFRFVVFVNGRPRSAILEVLRERLERDRDTEMREGLEAIIAIAASRRSR